MDNSIKGQDLNPNYHFPIYHEHDQGSCCWGYATARAFGKSWENPLCSARTINHINAIATTHFDRTTPFSYQNVAVGRHIKLLTDTDWEAGNHSLVWEGVSENGETVPSGIYFARLIHQKGVMTTKLLLTR